MKIKTIAETTLANKTSRHFHGFGKSSSTIGGHDVSESWSSRKIDINDLTFFDCQSNLIDTILITF